MRIAGRQVLDAFCRKHADARRWVEGWLADVGVASWSTPADVKEDFASASFLPGGVVIFNVKGNAYRLEVQIAYRAGVVMVSWAGAHAAYDRRNLKRGRRR